MSDRPFFTNITPRLAQNEVSELYKGLSEQETDENRPAGDGSYESFVTSPKRGQENLAKFPNYCKVHPVGA
jgi:hypothetical protein